MRKAHTPPHVQITQQLSQLQSLTSVGLGYTEPCMSILVCLSNLEELGLAEQDVNIPPNLEALINLHSLSLGRVDILGSLHSFSALINMESLIMEDFNIVDGQSTVLWVA